MFFAPQCLFLWQQGADFRAKMHENCGQSRQSGGF
jgi:hypothetical protein